MTKPDADAKRPAGDIDAELAKHLSTTLLRTLKSLKNHGRRMPRAHPEIDYLTLPLLHLLTDGSRRVSDIADHFGSEISGVSRQISTLVRVGFAEKVPDPGDGRASLVALTPRGHEFMADLENKRTLWMRDLLSGWTSEEVSEFARLLMRFETSLIAYERAYLEQHHPHHPAADRPAASAPRPTSSAHSSASTPHTSASGPLADLSAKDSQ